MASSTSAELRGPWSLIGIVTGILIVVAVLLLFISPNVGGTPYAVDQKVFAGALANWSSLQPRFAIAIIPWILVTVFGLPYFQAVRGLFTNDRTPPVRAGTTLLSLGLVAETAGYLAVFGYMSQLSTAYASALPSDRPDLVAFGATAFTLISAAGDGLLVLGVSGGLLLLGISGAGGTALPRWSTCLAVAGGVAGIIGLLVSLFVPVALIVVFPIVAIILPLWLFVSAIRIRRLGRPTVAPV